MQIQGSTRNKSYNFLKKIILAMIKTFNTFPFPTKISLTCFKLILTNLLIDLNKR